MKQFQFVGLLFYTAMVCFFVSCGGGESKKETSTESDTTTSNAPVAPQEVNTIITTPQNMMVVTHAVSNFAKWLNSYEEHDSLRLAFGIHSYVIGRGVKDSNMVLVAVKADDMDKAKAFAKDPSLKKAMQKGGVIGSPSISFLVNVFQDTSMLNPDLLRSRSSFMVKDWDTWEKGFKEGKQERLDNGLVDRVYGHDPDDNKKVSLVLAVTDTAKAFAYWKSDALKKRREASGVVSQPQRFLFRVVKRY